MKLDPSIVDAMRDLGAHPSDVQRHIAMLHPYEANRQIATIKIEAKRRFRALALELHPDRNNGDQEKSARLASLNAAMEVIEKMATRPMDRPQFAPSSGFVVRWSSMGGTSATTTSGSPFVIYTRITK